MLLIILYLNTACSYVGIPEVVGQEYLLKLINPKYGPPTVSGGQNGCHCILLAHSECDLFLYFPAPC